MRTPFDLDFWSREYVAEVLRVRRDVKGVADRALSLAEVQHTPNDDDWDERAEAGAVVLKAGLISHERRLGRNTEVPRPGPSGRFLYDLVVAYRGDLAVVALPYQEVARGFFPRLDRKLAGTGTRYEKLNITEIVVRLGGSGRLIVGGRQQAATEVEGGEKTSPPEESEIRVTRCTLAYEDPNTRDRVIRSATLSGDDLGQAKEYNTLITPVLVPPSDGRRVTPTALGISHFMAQVRKASVSTDRHGNFRFWVSPTMRGVEKVVALLETLQSLDGIVKTSTSVPILQMRQGE